MASNEDLSKMVTTSFSSMGIDKPYRQTESLSNRTKLLARRGLVNIGILALTEAKPGNQPPFARRQSLGLLFDVAGDWGISGDWDRPNRPSRRVFAVAEVNNGFDDQDAGRIYLYAEAPQLIDKDPRFVKLHTATGEFVTCALIGSEYPPYISPAEEIIGKVFDRYNSSMSRVEDTVARLSAEFVKLDSTTV